MSTSSRFYAAVPYRSWDHTPVGITPISLFLHSLLQICAWDSVGLTHQGCLDPEPNGTLQLLQSLRTRSSSAERNQLQQTRVGLCQLRI